MKILIINSFYYPNVLGGAEISVRHLAEEIHLLGHDVVVVCLGREELVEKVNGVKVYYLPLFNLYFPFDQRPGWISRLVWNLIDIYNPIMAKRVGKILDVEQPDIVHSNILLGFSSAVWREAAKRKIPRVHTLRDHLLLCPRSTMYKNGSNCTKQCLTCKLFSTGKKLMGNEVDVVVGISKYILNRHREFGWFNKADHRVVFNSFTPPAAETRHQVTKVLRFGCIGRITEFKGVELLVRTFRALGDDLKIELVLAGTGETEYVDRIKAMAHGTNVRFLGFVEAHEFYSQVDVVVVPSLVQEALGRAILEAYAYGKPVIASNRGGIPEIVEAGTTGLLFDPDIEGELERCLRLLFADEALLKRMAKAGQRKFLEFNGKRIASEYLAVYESQTKETAAMVSKTDSCGVE